MLKITTKEREFLISQGVPCGEDGISRSLKNKYWLCESNKNLTLLQNYKDSIIVKSVTK